MNATVKEKPGKYRVEYSDERTGSLIVEVLQDDIDATTSLEDAIRNSINEEGLPPNADIWIESYEIASFESREVSP